MSPTPSNNRLIDRLAFFISALASPYITITAFSIWIVTAYSHSLPEFLLWGGTALLFTVALPALYIAYGVRQGFFTDIHVMLREQRSEPFKVAIVSTLALTLVFWVEKAPRELLALAVTLWVTGIFFYVVTQFWKVSIHAAAYTGSVIITTFLVTPQALWFLCALPFITWARIHRQRHNIAQSIVAAGLVSMLIIAVLGIMRVP